MEIRFNLQKWENELLVWNASQYDGVTSIVVDKMYPWKPDIVLYNKYDAAFLTLCYMLIYCIFT